jgi:hypothetical protein
VNLHHASSRLRRATRWRTLPLHTKIAVGAWIPVALVAFALYTGPNRAPARTVAAPEQTAPATAPEALLPALPTQTVPPSTLPGNLAADVIPEITPRMPRGMSTQFRVQIERMKRERRVQYRNIMPLVREYTRQQAAERREALAYMRPEVLRERVRAKIYR